MGPGVLRKWFVTLCLCVFVVVCAVRLIFVMSADPWIELAFRMETAGKPLDMAEPVRSGLASRLAQRETGVCGDLARSRVTVAVDLIRRSVADNQPADAQARLTSAAAGVVADALYCNPSDANLWFVTALLESRLGAGWERIQTLLLMSASMAPFESDLLLKRSQLASLLLADGRAQVADGLKRDLRNAVALLDIPSALKILAKLTEGGRTALSTELTSELPETRRAALADGPYPKRSTFGKPDRFRRFDLGVIGRMQAPAAPDPNAGR